MEFLAHWFCDHLDTEAVKHAAMDIWTATH
jgi:hypothetical protein